MSTENKSPSYLADRAQARAWLQNTAEGRIAADYLKADGQGQALDDDQFVDWESLVKEHRGSAVLIANNREARESFDLARQAHSRMGAPMGHNHWRKIASTPQWYVHRRQMETGDVDYWKDPVNRYREFLAHPEWLCVPAWYVRSLLDNVLPKGPRPQAASQPRVIQFPGMEKASA